MWGWGPFPLFQTILLRIEFMQGRPTQKTTHPNKSTVCANNFGTICTNCRPPYPFKISRRHAKRVCANCLCKLFLFGWVVFWVGHLPLMNCPITQDSCCTERVCGNSFVEFACPYSIRESTFQLSGAAGPFHPLKQDITYHCSPNHYKIIFSNLMFRSN